MAGADSVAFLSKPNDIFMNNHIFSPSFSSQFVNPGVFGEITSFLCVGWNKIEANSVFEKQAQMKTWSSKMTNTNGPPPNPIYLELSIT